MLNNAVNGVLSSIYALQLTQLFCYLLAGGSRTRMARGDTGLNLRITAATVFLGGGGRGGGGAQGADDADAALARPRRERSLGRRGRRTQMTGGMRTLPSSARRRA